MIQICNINNHKISVAISPNEISSFVEWCNQDLNKPKIEYFGLFWGMVDWKRIEEDLQIINITLNNDNDLIIFKLRW